MRLGLHVQADRAIDKAIDYCARVQPEAMKWLSPSADVLARCRQVSPRTRHILRNVWSDQRLSRYSDFKSGTLSIARGLLNHPALKADADGPVLWVEGFNEHVTPSTPGDYLRDFARAEAGLARSLVDAGAGALIGGFSTGVLDEGKVGDFRAALQLCHDDPRRVALHFHEYAGAYMGLFVETPDGKNQWERPANRWNGYSATREAYYAPGLTGWLTLRYRKLIPYLDASGLGNVRFAITESGIDDTNPRPGGPNLKGWRDYANDPQWTNGPLGDIADQWHWYLSQITRDAARFVGVVGYGFGTIDPAWLSFDDSVEPAMLERIINRQLEIPSGAAVAVTPTPLPRPRPTPTPTPGAGLRPRATAAIEVRCSVAPGEGAAAFAGRAAGWPEATFAQRSAWAREIAAANNLETPAFRAGLAYRMPDAWFAVKEA